MKWTSNSILLLAAIAVASLPGIAQPRGPMHSDGPRRGRPGADSPILPGQRPHRGRPDEPGMAGQRKPPFPPLFEKLSQLPPEERSKALEADPHFQRMPPEKQEMIRRRLENFANMSEEQKAKMRERWGIMNGMSPEGRQRVREVFPRWNQISDERRPLVREEIRLLRGLSPAERERRLASPEFQKNFSPTEQQLLKEMAGLLR